MQMLLPGGDERTSLSGQVADGDHDVKLSIAEVCDDFGPMMGYINADAPHGFNRQWVNASLFGSRRKGFIAISEQMIQQSFRHLAASGIMRANEQDSFPSTLFF